uniref:Antimicrobial peptide brevinin-2ZHa n=1 Tax=Rana zhenhaiensis TaxID=120508 RepID=J9R412_9NEOB|nr:antimicrobial peptide brevinin-2ZHa precursor [Rana zhenhaiensis]
MLTLKKSMLLLFFLGTISLSLCQEERGAGEDEVIEEEVKRGIMRVFKGVLKTAGKSVAKNVAGSFLDRLKCKISGGC